jgi:TorA maturation chaperone TorD
MNQPLQFVRTLPPEEQARANFYALLARLFYAPPDAPLLQVLASEPDIAAADDALAAAWRDLRQAAQEASVEAVREEYEGAFVGTGKAPVTLYSGAYSARHTNDVPLAALRGELAALGLARRGDAGEPEDHIAALCDTMRYLIVAQDEDMENQKRFFARWIKPAAEPLCAAIEQSGQTAFYKHVGRFAKAFLTLEHAAFEMF